MSHSRFLKLVFATSLTLFVIIGSFNYLMNPFYMFNTPQIQGFNEVKPRAANRIAVFKKYQPIYFQPKTIIVGNSRVEMGLNPEHRALGSRQPVYNLGVPGPAIRGQLSHARYLTERSDVKTIILALDYRDFLDQQWVEHSELLPLETNELSDKMAALLSLDALESAVATLLNQHASSPNRLPNGFNPANEYRDIIRLEGQEVLFRHQLTLLESKLTGKKYHPEKIEREILILEKIITEWLANNIEVILFINPYHHDYYTTLGQFGLLSSFNMWRDLVSSRFSKRIRFCDFTSFGQEKSHYKNTLDELKFFWEPSHYKQELGDIMIPMILDGCSHMQ